MSRIFYLSEMVFEPTLDKSATDFQNCAITRPCPDDVDTDSVEIIRTEAGFKSGVVKEFVAESTPE